MILVAPGLREKAHSLMARHHVVVDSDTVLVNELLLAGMEGSYLIEMRNGIEGIASGSVEEFRANVSGSLIRLAGDGLLTLGLATWGALEEAKYADPRIVHAMLQDGSAWDPAAELLLVIQATDAGERAFRGRTP